LNRRAHWPAAIATSGALLLIDCAHAPPADFVPDPGLVAQIRDLRFNTMPPRVCPGGTIQASYDAILADGSHVPFARTYDEKHPPRLHVVFLERSSPDALSPNNGDWVTNASPLWTAMTGFRLTAALAAKPTVHASVVVPPDYSCLPHSFSVSGEPGGAAQAGGNGPDVTVRLAILRSPFYDRLLVAAVEVGYAPPFYVLADGTMIPPANWLDVESRGGRGGQGTAGQNGADGAAGQAGCPAQPGGPGGNGGGGGSGGSGGRGGRVTIIVSADNPFLAGLVDARSPGGSGGAGGAGGSAGKGGKGGAGGSSGDNRRCVDAADGALGQRGNPGAAGPQGAPGSRPEIVTLPTADVFGSPVPPELGALIGQAAGRRRP
jgi:hypothetical protein